MTLPLDQKTIALAEGRQLEELAQMLEREGATPLCCPLVSIVDAPDAAPVIAWLHDLIARQFAYVVLFTGEGLRRLLGFAERQELRDAAIEALAETRTVTRGPKPVRALKEIALKPTLVAQTPTTDGVIEVLRSQPLQGQTIGVQLYPTNLPGERGPLVDFLEQAGAKVRTVIPYVYAPASDTDRVVDLLNRMAQGSVAAIVFTSAPQVDRLYEVAADRGVMEMLRQGLSRTAVAAVGPVVADNLRQRGARVDIVPEQGFVMKNLVLQIKRALGHEGGG